jgi:hypothetical protein
MSYKGVDEMKKTLVARLTLAMLIGLLSLPVAAAIWETKQQWNDQWEDRFSDWVRKSYGKHFFTKGKYANIPHDCADSTYYARLIFAYENKLPFLIKDPRYPNREKIIAEHRKVYEENYGKSPFATINEMISNDMKFYDDLPEAERLRRFMKFVGDVVGTNSLMEDTYPIKVDRKWFRPGVVAALPRIESKLNPLFFGDGNSDDAIVSAGHAQIVTDVDQFGVIHYLKSTVPAKIQDFQHTTLNSFVPGPKGGSFRYWRQPQHYGKPESALPGYGIDQYDFKGVFEDAVRERLALQQEEKGTRLKRLAGEVCQQVKDRVSVVEEAWQYKQKIGSRCMDFKEFDSYSTPSRDTKIEKALGYLIHSAGGGASAKGKDLSQVAEYLEQACGSIEYLPGKKITAARFAERLMAGKVSSDPNQNPAVRWGDKDSEDLGCKQFY